MSRSLIQVANQSNQAVEEEAIIPLGTVQRRFGCNLKLSGNAIETNGAGYYIVDGTVSISPTDAGAVTVALYNNGVPVQGVVAYGTGVAGSPLTLPISGTVRPFETGILTLVLVEGAGTVSNAALRVVRV